LAGAKISIENTKIKAKFTPSKATSAASTAFAITTDGAATPITAVSTTVLNDVSTDFTTQNVKYHDVIIVPQTVAANENFIKLHLAAGGDLYYKIPTGNITFDSGKKYIYHITVNLTGLTVTSTITDWTAESAVPGDASM
jgi:hypothetical protein